MQTWSLNTVGMKIFRILIYRNSLNRWTGRLQEKFSAPLTLMQLGSPVCKPWRQSCDILVRVNVPSPGWISVKLVGRKKVINKLREQAAKSLSRVTKLSKKVKRVYLFNRQARVCETIDQSLENWNVNYCYCMLKCNLFKINQQIKRSKNILMSLRTFALKACTELFTFIWKGLQVGKSKK